jgi:SOS-response transcriptional repressor LexA
MNKYQRCLQELKELGTSRMTVFGNSMLPIIKTGSTLTFEKRPEYEIGDIVFCKVKGRFIDAHKIVAKNQDRGYQIANNKGWINGWTHAIYGKVTKIG